MMMVVYQYIFRYGQSFTVFSTLWVIDIKCCVRIIGVCDVVQLMKKCYVFYVTIIEIDLNKKKDYSVKSLTICTSSYRISLEYDCASKIKYGLRKLNIKVVTEQM